MCWRMPKSVNALMIIVVDDIDSIAPRNRESMNANPSKCPTASPMPIMHTTIIRAVTTAEPPTLSSFLKLNSSPSENSSATMPICAQKSMLASLAIVGKKLKCGPTRNPATM